MVFIMTFLYMHILYFIIDILEFSLKYFVDIGQMAHPLRTCTITEEDHTCKAAHNLL